MTCFNSKYIFYPFLHQKYFHPKATKLVNGNELNGWNTEERTQREQLEDGFVAAAVVAKITDTFQL